MATFFGSLGAQTRETRETRGDAGAQRAVLQECFLGEEELSTA